MKVDNFTEIDVVFYGTKIKKLREQAKEKVGRKITLEEIGKILFYSKAVMYQLEQQEKIVKSTNLDSIYKLADRLMVKPEELFKPE